MKKLTTKTIERRVVAEITCDKCGMSITTDDFAEWQEVMSIQFTGGFGSVFGDGLTYEIDLCQRCLKETLGTWMRCTTEMCE